MNAELPVAPWKVPIPPDPLEPHKLEILHQLSMAPGRLFAILDGARSERILELLYAHAENACVTTPPQADLQSPRVANLYQSLYIGQLAEDTAEQGPLLTMLDPKSELLRALVLEGWGDSWGIYFSSGQSFPEAWRHFRKFLLVELPTKKTAFFRYYDPRVFRNFLPTCSPQQKSEMLAPIIQIYAEDSPQPTARVWRYPSGSHGLSGS